MKDAHLVLGVLNGDDIRGTGSTATMTAAMFAAVRGVLPSVATVPF